MKKSNILHIIILLTLLTLGFFMRSYNLYNVPAGFFADEAAIGFNAYSILNTGKDEFGVSFPLFFESFGDYKPSVSIYSTVPLVAIFGLNETSVRTQSVIYGIIALVMLYLLTKELFSKKLALLCVAIASTMPWLIHYNRTGFELNSYVAFFTASIYLLLKSTKQKNYLIPAFTTSGITLYTYYSAKLLVPLLLIGFFVIYKNKLLNQKKLLFVGLASFLLLSIPVVQSFFTGEGLARFNDVSVFSANLPFAETLFKIINNYFFQFSPMLFINGEPTPILRHFTSGLAPLLFATIPFLYIGITAVFLKWKTKSSQLIIFWLLLYPIGAAVVADAPFTGRTVIGAPLAAILISVGMFACVNFGKKIVSPAITSSILCLIVAFSFLSFANFYFITYPLNSSGYWGWQYGPKYIVGYFTEQEDKYDEMFMIPEFNAPHIFFKFYAPNGCGKCRLGTPHESYNPQLKQLFAVTPTYLISRPEINFLILETIYYPDNTIAFVIGKIN